jgi:hypothetical protein
MALATSLIYVLVLTILGTAVYWTTRRDIVHTGLDVKRVRADFAAESAAQWALIEVARYDGGRKPFTRGTHDPTGMNPIPIQDSHGNKNPAALHPDELANYAGSQVRLDADGWIVLDAGHAGNTFSRGGNEVLSFKVWYPDSLTMRVTGKAKVEGTVADIDVISRLDSAWVPF